MEMAVAIVQPTGHANQIPMALCVRSDRRNAKITRSAKSVKVAAINCRMALMPRRIPSAISLADTNKIERRQNPQKLPSRQHSRCRVSFHEQKEQIFSEKNIEGARKECTGTTPF